MRSDVKGLFAIVRRHVACLLIGFGMWPYVSHAAAEEGETPIFIGIALGSVKYVQGQADAQAVAAAQSGTAMADDKTSVVRVWGGYQFESGAALEMGMHTSGNFGRTVLQPSGDSSTRVMNVVSFIVQGSYSERIWTDLDVFGKAGLAASEVTVSSYAGTEGGAQAKPEKEGATQIGLAYALGVSYNYSKNVAFQASVDILNTKLKTATESGSVRLQSFLLGVQIRP